MDQTLGWTFDAVRELSKLAREGIPVATISLRLKRPVTLAEIKADPDFKDLALVRQGRLSVVPVEERLWKKLLAMGGS